jgi:hypothetical protein
MMSSRGIIACLNPRSANWQIGELPVQSGAMILLGWIGYSQVDGGVPAEVAECLSSFLSKTGTVMFLRTVVDGDSHRPEQNRDFADIVLPVGGVNILRKLVSGILLGPEPKLEIVATRSRDSIRQIFVEQSMMWTLQSQCVLLLERQAEPIRLDRADILSFFSKDWAHAITRMSALGALGALRPGTDGDVAALFCVREKDADDFLAMLEADAKASGLSCQIVSEDTFIALL